jgi:hypothetical protein
MPSGKAHGVTNMRRHISVHAGDMVSCWYLEVKRNLILSCPSNACSEQAFPWPYVEPSKRRENALTDFFNGLLVPSLEQASGLDGSVKGP